MLVDFHVHSTASDGSYRPDAIARMTDGFAYAALTDHDTCDGAAAFLDEPSGGGKYLYESWEEFHKNIIPELNNHKEEFKKNSSLTFDLGLYYNIKDII